MFPPSIMETPTSPTTLPKPVRIADRIMNFDSRTVAEKIFFFFAPKVIKVSWNRGSSLESPEYTIDVTNGNARIDCPIMIAKGVNKIREPLHNPELEIMA